MDRLLQVFVGDGVDYMHLVGYVVYRVQAFSGIHGSSFRSLRWQRETYKCLCKHTWIADYKPLVANRVVYNPLGDYVDRRLKAFGRLRGSSFAGLWWHTWIFACKPLVAFVDHRSEAFGGRWRYLQAFGGIRGSSCASLLVAYVDRRVEAFGGIRGLSFASLWWHTWIAVRNFGGRYSRLQAFGGVRGFSCISLWWHTWIVVHKHLAAYGAIYKPLVLYVDRRLQAFGGYFCGSQAFGGRWSLLQAFRGWRGSPFKSLWWQMESYTSLSWHTWIVVYMPLVAYVDRRLHALGRLRGSPFTSLWWQMESFTSLWWHVWNVVYNHLAADGAFLKPLVVYVDRRLQAIGG